MSNLILPSPPGKILVRRSLVNDTQIQSAVAGNEYRVANYSTPRYRYEVSYNFLRSGGSYTEAQQIVNHLVRHAGRRESFLFQDPEDYTVTAAAFGVGNSSAVAFQLQRAKLGPVTDVTGTWQPAPYARANACLRSSALATSPWTLDVTGGAATGTRTNDYAIAPDGTRTATRVVVDANSARLHQQISVTAGESLTFSFFHRRAAGSVTPRMSVADVTHSTYILSATAYTLATSAWGFASYAFTVPAGCAAIQIAPLHDPGAGAYEFWLWGAQLEWGALATRRIATTTSLVRVDPAYWPQTSDGYEPIRHPDWQTVSVYLDGVATSAWTPTADGIVTFGSAPGSGVTASWSGQYHRRVRFDDDELELERIVDTVYSGDGIPLIEVRA